MIRISQIDSDFSIYKNSIVILYGLGDGFKEIIDLYKYHNVNVDYICDNNKVNWGEIRQSIPVISPEHLKHIVDKNNENKLDYCSNIVIQIAMKNSGCNFQKQIYSINAENVISYGEGHKILSVLSFEKLYKSDPSNPYFSYKQPNNKDKSQVHYIIETKETTPIFIAQTQKTGDMTLVETFKANNIPYYFTNHNPNFFDKELFVDKKIKITTAIREPICKSVSNMYQTIFESGNYLFLFDSTKHNFNFYKNGGDAQELFDKMIESRIKAHSFNSTVFMERLKEHIIDLSQYPFNKEKGYSIIKEGNIEVFVYQLEKMNDVVKEMSDWIGKTSFDEWVMGNVAADKWIYSSYKQAQKELQITQEHFDLCYEDKWIQHFYSQEDIEKFKERWHPHIR